MLEILIGIIIALITFHLSIERFRSEKWWEMKVSAYQNVITALHETKKFYNCHLDAEMTKNNLPEDRQKELLAKAVTSQNEILKSIDLGAFLFSDEAVARLKKYKDKDTLNYHDDWFTYLDENYAAAQNCIEDITILAKKDLERFENGYVQKIWIHIKNMVKTK